MPIPFPALRRRLGHEWGTLDGGAFLRRVRRRARSSVRFDPCRYGEADATDELDPSPQRIGAFVSSRSRVPAAEVEG